MVKEACNSYTSYLSISETVFKIRLFCEINCSALAKTEDSLQNKLMCN